MTGFNSETPSGSITVEAEDLRYDDDFIVSRIDDKASGGRILRVRSDRRNANATTTFDGPDGTYNLRLYAYDENDGAGQLRVWVNGRRVSTTVLDKNLGSYLPNSQTQVQILIENLSLGRGDSVEIEARRDRNEWTSLDKLVFEPLPKPEPTRIVVEAEALNYDRDWAVSGIDPNASGGEILRVRRGRRADAWTRFDGAPGTYTLTLDAYDENDGNGQLSVWVNRRRVISQRLDQNLGSNLPDGSTRVQIVVDDLALNRGDLIWVEAKRDRGERTSLDKITFAPVETNPNVEIISNGGGPSAVVSVDEGAAFVTDFEVNLGDEDVEYSINGGADRDFFNIDAATGALSFKAAPDWETPLDAGANNVYEVNVVAVGSGSGDGQFLSVVVNDLNNPDPTPGTPDGPVTIISNDTGAPNNQFTSINVLEGIRSVTDVNVAGSEVGVRYRINAGADKDLFVINPETGVVSFKAPPDFESPIDQAAGNAVAGNNVYEINVLAQRGNQTDSQFMTISVQDTDEASATEPIPVYLMAGQSNLVGVARTENLSDPSYTQPFSAASIWSRPSQSFVDLASGFDGQSVKMGPELSFGRQIVANTGEQTYLIKYGLGATSLAEDWRPDGSGTQFNTFRDVSNAALDSLTSDGLTYEIKGLVWMQGESDTYDDDFAVAYEDNLLGFIDEVRDAFGEDLDIAIGLIRNDLPTSAANRELVRNAQRAVSSGDDNVFLVDTDALGGSEVLRLGDTTHYNADGQVLLGNAFADAFVV